MSLTIRRRMGQSLRVTACLALSVTAVAQDTDFDAAWDYSDPAGTEARFREMAPAVSALSDPDLSLQL